MLHQDSNHRQDSDHQWVSAHVFTAHPLDLVVQRLLPDVLDDLRRRGLADRFFFIRHWQFGPHVRLRVRLTTPDTAPEVRETLDAHAAALFRSQPSTRTMTDRQYAELAERFSVMEPGSEPGALAPNDSLAFIPYLPEHAKYGYGAALRAVEDSFSTCSELALAATAASWAPARQLAYCFALLAGSLDPGARPAVRQSPAVVEQYRRRRAALLPVARSARAALAADAIGGADDDDPAAHWFASFRRARDLAADPGLLSGHLTHLACNRLGVRLDQEAALRQLAGLAVDELTCGTDAAVGFQ